MKPLSCGNLVSGPFELRYRIYCLEFGYLPADNFPSGQETDEFDDHSAHFCEHSGANEPQGYVRLIHSHTGSGFPLEKRCTFYDGVRIPLRHEAVEISRLVVRQDHRRRRNDRPLFDQPCSVEKPIAGERRKFSHQILLRIYRQMYAYSLSHGIRYWLAAMERPLARSLAIGNFAFETVGPAADYYGQVTPYMADLRVLEARLRALNPQLLAWMQLPPETPDRPDRPTVEPKSMFAVHTWLGGMAPTPSIA